MKHLAILRRAKRLTQADVAKVLGVTRSAVSNWETGYAEPSLSQTQQYARLVGTQLALTLEQENPDD